MTLKLSPHHMGGNKDTERWWTVSTCAKFVGDLGLSSLAPPGVLTIGRVVDDGLLWGQGFDANRYYADGADPALLAASYVTLVWGDKIKLNPGLQVIEGPNEQIITASGPMEWYAKFSREFARIIQGLGRRAGIGSWSTGHPLRELGLWPFWAPALDAVIPYNAILTRHSYSDLNAFHALRHRYDNEIFTAMGYPDSPVVITECGTDASGTMLPWRKNFVDAAQYWNTYLVYLENEFQLDPYLVGATLFTVGRNDERWKDHDVAGSGLVDFVLAHAQAQPPALPPPEPVPEPTPEPPPVEPPSTTVHTLKPHSNFYVASLFQETVKNNPAVFGSHAHAYLQVMERCTWTTDDFRPASLLSILDWNVINREYDVEAYPTLESLATLTDDERQLLIAQFEAWHW